MSSGAVIPDRVVLRQPLWLRVAAVLPFIIGVVLLKTLWSVLFDPGTLHGLARVGLGALAVVLGPLCVLPLPLFWRLSQTYNRTEVIVRKLFSSTRIELSSATQIDVTRAKISTGRSRVPFDRITVTGPQVEGGRLPQRALIDPFMDGAERGFAIVGDWARQRPEIATEAAKDAFGLAGSVT